MQVIQLKNKTFCKEGNIMRLLEQKSFSNPLFDTKVIVLEDDLIRYKITSKVKEKIFIYQNFRYKKDRYDFIINIDDKHCGVKINYNKYDEYAMTREQFEKFIIVNDYLKNSNMKLNPQKMLTVINRSSLFDTSHTVCIHIEKHFDDVKNLIKNKKYGHYIKVWFSNKIREKHLINLFNGNYNELPEGGTFITYNICDVKVYDVITNVSESKFKASTNAVMYSIISPKEYKRYHKEIEI